jgi:hypothetical protein
MLRELMARILIVKKNLLIKIKNTISIKKYEKVIIIKRVAKNILKIE